MTLGLAEFLASAASLLAGAALPAVPALPTSLRKPPALRRGDRVGLIAPASPPEPHGIATAIAHVMSLGLIPVLGRHTAAHDGYLAGSDAARAADFNAMARDPEIRAIVAIRGGYGTMRILPLIDYGALRKDPKVVLGYSDMTAVLNAVTVRSGIVTFHGPVGAHGSLWDGPAGQYLERTLFSTRPVGQLSIASPQRILGGKARGRLAGGNLTLIASLVGTPYAVPAAGALLFFEETEEAPYRIDRMLTQLDLAGDLRAASGFLVGQCTKCTSDEPSPPAGEVIAARLRSTGKPALEGAPFGHIPTQWVLPIGLPAELDVAAATLSLNESAVYDR